MLAVAPELFVAMEGTTDSELMFHLALTFGPDADPMPALERMAGFVEDTGRIHGRDSLFVTTDAAAVRSMHPEESRLRAFSDEARAIVGAARRPPRPAERGAGGDGVDRPGRRGPEGPVPA